MQTTFYHILSGWMNLLPSVGKSLSWRGRLASKVLKSCGSNLKIASLVNIYNPNRLSCGDNVYIGYCTYIGGGDVYLDDEVIIGPFCSIVAGNHTSKEGSYRFGPYDYGEIKIGKGTWLGSHVTITSNVTVGKGCVIAANAVVTKDVPDFTMVGGVPAKEIKTLTISS